MLGFVGCVCLYVGVVTCLLVAGLVREQYERRSDSD